MFHEKNTIFSRNVRHPLESQSRVANQDREAGDCASSPGYGRRTVPAETTITASADFACIAAASRAAIDRNLGITLVLPPRIQTLRCRSESRTTFRLAPGPALR